MRSRLKYIVPGLLVVACVWFFWPHVRHAVVKKLAKPTMTMVHSASTAPVLIPSAHSLTNKTATATNKFAYRVSNTSKTIGQLTGDRHAILLENAFIDTTAAMNLTIPAKLKAKGDPGAFIVQAKQPINALFRSLIAGAGGQIVSYIPNNAYLVQMSAGAAAALGGNAQVQAVIPYEPYYKVQSSLFDYPMDQPLPANLFLTLGIFAGNANATLAQIVQLGGQIMSQDRSPFGLIVRVRAPADWMGLADLPGVQLMEPAHLKKSANDLSRVSLGVSTDTLTNANYLSLYGSNVLVEVNDTGIDVNHPDFNTGGNPTTAGGPPIRVTGDNTNSLDDIDGHGTHVAGIIAGNGAESFTVTNVPQGSVTNADFRGKAPLADLFSVGFLGANDFGASDSYLQEEPARTNALISNNSWVNDGDTEYDLSAASYDAAVRDALPGITGPQPVLFVFAAGNDGSGDDSGGSGNPDSIESPGTAKNVITVGSLDEPRGITNIVTDINSNMSAIWFPETSSAQLVSFFSARGNVGVGSEGTFGRFKPDVVAPGTFVVSTRSTTWDQIAYYNPTNISDLFAVDQLVDTNGAVDYTFPFNVFSNCVDVSIQILPNSLSPSPFPSNTPVYVSLNNFPSPPDTSTYDFSTANNGVTIPPDGPPNYLNSIINNFGIFNFGVGDPTTNLMNFDMLMQMITTNDLGNQLTVLSNLNQTIGPWYRYETGTSMSAGSVSGVLALMQDFFVNHRNPNFATNPSPALLKAMLINGSRLTGFYNFQVNDTINFEGWGQINLPNSIPTALTNATIAATNSFFFVDQSPTNALTTGESRVYHISLTPTAQQIPLRITLAWTDPPGNPAAAIKLVNNLDLIVTNTDNPTNPVAYFGNDIADQQQFNTPENPTNLVSDSVNNIENVFLPPLSGTNFTVVVNGTAVNVNALTIQTNDALGNYAPNIAQDFALVISCGDGSNTNGFGLTMVPPISNPTDDQLVTIVTSTNVSPLMNQFVGANSPVLNTNFTTFNSSNTNYATNAIVTLGTTNQWHFYIVTNFAGNASDVTNAAFITFLPNTASIPREGVLADSDANSTRPEADIDLFVTTDSSLTNLNPLTISNCINGAQVNMSIGGVFNGAALTRGGSEFVVDTNSTPGQIYYVGVKSEDQMASEYAFLSEFSSIPFSQLNSNGDESVTFYPSPVVIPDGNAVHAGFTNAIGLAIYPITIQRIVATNILAQQNVGDLTISLNHPTVGVRSSSIVLLNHDSPNAPGIYTNIYDDSGQGDIVGSQPADGPGSLSSYATGQGQGIWIMHSTDNTPGFIGSVASSIFIEKHKNLTDPPFITVSIPPNSWFYDFVEVPVGNTNLTVFAVDETPVVSQGPLTLAVNPTSPPTLTNALVSALLTNVCISPPGLSNSVSVGPPLIPGIYWVGVFNPDSVAHTVEIGAFLFFDAAAITTLDYTSAGPVPLLDDAVTDSDIFVTNTDTIQTFKVGLRIDHPRISDLAITLIDPNDNRYLLMENRGGQTTNGCGATLISTNVVASNATGNNGSATNTIDVQVTRGTLPISYDFFTVPDRMTVYYGTNLVPANLVFDSGLVSGSNTVVVSYPPGSPTAPSTFLTIVMNQFGNDATNGDLWTYTAGGVLTNFVYLDFTEDTNLTTTPIKFAPPPFAPPASTVMTNLVEVWHNSFEDSNNTTYFAPAFFAQGWSVDSGSIDLLKNGTGFGTAFEGQNYIDINGNDAGTISTNIATVPGTQYIFSFAYTANPNAGSSVAAQVSLGGVPVLTVTALPTNSFASLDWLTTQVVFTATSPTTAIQFASQTSGLSGMLLDDVDVSISEPLTNFDGNLYYQPEVSLDPLIDTFANGTGQTNHEGRWRLEVLDNRAGAADGAVLQSWQLEFEFANTNIAIVPTVLTNGLPSTNIVAAGGIDWFQINTLTNADIATNMLFFATAPVNFFWTTNAPQTTNVPPSALLAGLTTGTTNIFGTNAFEAPFGNPAFFTPGQTYYLGVQNPNPVAVQYALDVTFHLRPEAPFILTLPATSITTSNALLNMVLLAEGLPTTAWFEWGTDTNYGNVTTNINLTTGLNFFQFLNSGITNLAPGTVYHFQAVATNAIGTNFGGDLTFTSAIVMLPPYAFTMPGTLLTGTNAQLNGMGTPNGVASRAWFEWGSSVALGVVTAPVNIGAGEGVVYVTNQITTNLLPDRAIYYRLDVSNALGLTRGFIHVFNQANVVAWGNNGNGQTTVPLGLTNNVGIGGGSDFSLALNSDGTVDAWGDGNSGETNVPPFITNAVAVYGGLNDCIALRSDGSVIAWGGNNFFQTNIPPSLTNAVAATSGTFHCLAVKADGFPVAWGADFAGQTNIPAGLSNIVAVAGGEFHSVALKNDGTIVTWGLDNDGQTNVPPSATNVVGIAAGDNFNIALRGDGSIVGWGENQDGQISGIPTGTNFLAIAAAGSHCLALTVAGGVVAWGDPSSSMNVLPAGLTNVVGIACGEIHNLALSSIFGLNVTNTPPFWTNGLAGTTVTMVELTTSNVVNTATDTNLPPLTLSYTLLNAPGFATISSQGIITFAPPEGAGSNTYTITTVVSNSGHPPLSATNSFTLVVEEANTAPFFPTNEPNDYLALTNSFIVITNFAVQTNFPPNPITYDLTFGPAGATMVDSNTGAITWTTPPAPGTFTFTNVATDTDPFDFIHPTLSTTNVFTVTVINSSSAPFWPIVPLPDQTTSALTNYSLVVTALDFTVPHPHLTYSLDNQPTGMTISTVGTNGVIHWTPTLLQVGTFNNILVIVSDNILPTSQRATNTFNITVTSSNLPPSLTNNIVNISSIVETNIGGNNGFLLTWFAATNDLFQVQWTPSLAPVTWTTFTNIVSYDLFIAPTNSQFQFFDDASQTGGSFGTNRFYRLILLGGGGGDTLTLPVQTNITTMAGTPIVVTNTATDSNPSATISYSLTTSPTSSAAIDNNGTISWTPPPTATNTATLFTTIATDSITSTTATNSFAVFVGPFSSISNVTIVNTNVTLQWTAPTNDLFNVRWTTNLIAPIQWTVFPSLITSTTGVFSFTDTNGLTVMKFYQLMLLP